MNMPNEQNRLLRDISIIDFVIVDMNQYLDTHPTDQDAIEYVKHYVRLKNNAMQEYARKYGPLSLNETDQCTTADWKWVMSPWPWEGEC